MGRLPEVESVFVLVYDAWMDDEQSYLDWVDFFHRHTHNPTSLCELACGTGNITKHIAPYVKRYVASDIDCAMLEQAKAKVDDHVEFKVLDMREFSLNETFDCILCAADSMNFNETISQLQQTVNHVKKHLKKGGTFIFDVHHPSRATQYSQEYVESGIVESIPYEYYLKAENQTLTHEFHWYQHTYPIVEIIKQTIFTQAEIQSVFDANQWKIEVENDMKESGFVDGEKWNICATYKGG